MVVVRKRQRTDGSAAVVQFLPRMVLLVEADDSTRQIIAALLRKCSYKVTAVSDGLKAWEILKGKHHNIDLVLTEVDLPSISGFALLTLVMEHDVCKNIPVIMMSLHDSISMVLKCMLKGAADFLIKPVRKNELRNLWQHVWRRRTLTGAYNPQITTVTQKKVEPDTEKNTASNHSSDYVMSSEREVKGSDTQSSCTTLFLEAENAYVQNIQGLPLSKCNSASKLSNSDIEKQKCAKLSNETVLPESETKEKSSKFGSKFTASFNETYKSIALRLEEDCVCAEAMTHYEGVGSESAGSGNITSEINGHSNEVDKPLSGVIDLIGTFDNHPLSSHVHSCCINSHTTKFECLPQLELSLRRFCPSSLKDDETDERCTLNHSNASAFSWYNSYNNKTVQSLFPTLAGSSELKEGTDEILDLLSNHHFENVAAAFPQHDATLGNNQENTTFLLNSQSGLQEISFSRPHLGIAGYGHLFPSVFHTKSDIGSAWSPKSSCQQEQSPSVQTNTATNNNMKQGCYRSDESCADQIVNEKNNMEGMEILRRDFPTAGQSCSSGLCNGVVTQLNSSSGYGSNISSRSDGASATATAPLVDKANAPESSLEGGLISQQDGLRGPGSHSHRTSQREAALTKFRLKRKDRCFEKKVRYQSRKRLAEQRPRVKGQFVRQLQTLVAAADGCPQQS